MESKIFLPYNRCFEQPNCHSNVSWKNLYTSTTKEVKYMLLYGFTMRFMTWPNLRMQLRRS